MKTRFLIILFGLQALTAFSAGISIVTPKNNQVCSEYKVAFNWNRVLGYTTYRLRFSGTPDFSTIIKDTVIVGTRATISFPPSSSVIYWKVQTASAPGYMSSDVNSFRIVNPSQNPNLLVWLAADSNVVLQPDSTIDSWNNIIPNGLNAVQTTPASRPRLINNIQELANRRSVRFDGLDDFLRINSGGELGSCYFVANWRGGGAFPSFNGMLTNQNIAVLDDYIMIMESGTTRIFGLGYFGTNTYINNVFGNSMLPMSTYKVVSGRRSTAIKSFPNFSLGRTTDFNAHWNGDFSEFIISKTNRASESDSIHTYLYAKYAPPVDLGPDTVLGTSFSDPVILGVPARFATYLWSSGSTTNTASVLSGGTYSLKVKDNFGIESEDEIDVYPYRRLKNREVFLCAGDSLVVNLGITSPFTFLWSTGATGNQITIKNAGMYTVRVTDFKGQSVFDTLNVIVDNPSVSPSPSGSNLTLCEGEKLFATTQSAYDSLVWSTGSTSSFITITTPGAYSVYGRTTAGCILNKTFNITIAGKAPAADFISGTSCEKTATAFTDLSTFPVGDAIITWKWSFGDGNTSAAPAPSNAYTNVGTYTASLKVTTNVGCSDSIVKTVIVRKKPKADFFNLLSCSGNPTTFVDNSLSNADSLVSWSWDFNGLGTSAQKNPVFSFPAANVYNTLLRVTNSNGCSDTVTRQTIVNPSPVANFKADSNCAGTNTIFTNLSTVPAPYLITNYLWEYGDESQAIQTSPPHLYATYGEYNVRLSVRASNQCVDTVEKTVRVFAKPDVDFALSNTQCTGKNIQFNDQSTTPDGSALSSWQWFFAGQGTSTAQNPSFAFSAQGNYTIQLTARTTAGCAGTQFRSIAVTSPPAVNFSFTPNYGPPPLNVSYTNLSPTGGNYIWDYGDGSPTFQGFTPPPHNYTVRGTYPIKLLATDFKGCSDSLVRDILVDNAVVDGVMVTVNVVPNGDFYKVVVTVLNNSNIEVTSLGITIRLANGSEVRETWTGSLKPGTTVIYPFVGQLRYNANDDIPVICATIESININAVENDLSNNTTCEEITVGQFDVLTVFPNPATEYVNFGVMLPENGGVEITLYDMLGKLLYTYAYNGVTGYNSFRMPVQTLNGALYVAEVKYNDQLIRRKVMRGDRGN